MGDEGKAVEINENPFSFKRFLKKCDDGSINNGNSEHIIAVKNTETIKSCDDPKDITEEIPFPDVKKDSPMVKKKSKAKKGKNSNKSDEISAGEDENPFSFKNFVKKDAAFKTSGRVLQIIDDEVCEVVNSEDMSDPLEVDNIQEKSEERNVVNTLRSSELELNLQEDLGDQIIELENENKKLKRELKEMKQLREDESKKVASLVKKLKVIEQKENEETAALEKMVHMVEKNLELTTQRALKAEATAAKLREENKVLKSNSISKVVYDDLVTQHHQLLANIKEQANSASQHLNATASKAEESLKQLRSGVESFKQVSELLKSIDRFSKVHESPT